MSEHSTVLIQGILGNLFHNIGWQAVEQVEDKLQHKNEYAILLTSIAI
jgi:hypothetical protein